MLLVGAALVPQGLGFFAHLLVLTFICSLKQTWFNFFFRSFCVT